MIDDDLVVHTVVDDDGEMLYFEESPPDESLVKLLKGELGDDWEDDL